MNKWRLNLSSAMPLAPRDLNAEFSYSICHRVINFLKAHGVILYLFGAFGAHASLFFFRRNMFTHHIDLYGMDVSVGIDLMIDRAE